MLNKILRSITLGRAYRRVPQVLRPCPLCGATEHRTVCRHDRNFLGLTTVCCQRCRFCFTNPYPDEASVGRFYKDIYRQTVKGETEPDAHSKEARSRSARMSYYAVRLLRHCPDMRSYLDVGCGDGGLAEALSTRRPDLAISLVEKNRAFLSFAAERSGGRGYGSLAELAGAAPTIDAISLIHVLEHFVDPLGVLRELRALAHAGTRLVIDVPDAEQYTSLSDVHYSHPSHFTAPTLRSALALTGFEVLHLERHAPPVFPPSLLVVCTPSQTTQAPDESQHPDIAPVFAHLDHPWRFIASRLGL